MKALHQRFLRKVLGGYKGYKNGNEKNKAVIGRLNLYMTALFFVYVKKKNA